VSTAILLAATAVVAALLGFLSRQPAVRRLRAAYAEATWRADHDPLTTLPNRTLATRDLQQHTQHQRPAVVALLDLDNLKQVNDTYGHDAGDQLIATVARRLASLARTRGGTAYRISGDEFLLLLPATATGQNAADDVADMLVQLATPMRLHCLDGARVQLTPTASAGVAHFDGYDGTSTMLLRRADLALYQAKHRRSGYAVYHPRMATPPLQLRRSERLRDQDPTGSTTPPVPDD
jgi:diguanylate cyclase (GGDEF)-like protein